MTDATIKIMAWAATIGTLYVLPNVEEMWVIVQAPTLAGILILLLLCGTQPDIRTASLLRSRSEDGARLTVILASVLALMLPVLEWRNRGAPIVAVSDYVFCGGAVLALAGIVLRRMEATGSTSSVFPLRASGESVAQVLLSRDFLGVIALLVGYAMIFRAPWSGLLGFVLVLLGSLRRSRSRYADTQFKKGRPNGHRAHGARSKH
jgi:hypothetical protein